MKSTAAETITLDARPISIREVVAVARGAGCVALGAEARRAMDLARSAMLAQARGGTALYGINTGFGSFASVRLDAKDLTQLQLNIVRSHSAGLGEPLDGETVRATMVVLAASLARGHSGVRSEVVDSILLHLNHAITPIVPSRGSVGASGDLAPLAHIALALIGEGEVHYKGVRGAARSAHASCGIAPLVLEEKEGLALLNGTHLMAGLGALVLDDAWTLAHAATVATAMAIDGCRGTHAMLDERIHEVRRQPGQVTVARNLRGLLWGGTIAQSHATQDPRVQDPYSLRAAPQVLGAVIDALEFAGAAISRELGAVTDNPLVFATGNDRVDIVSGANFHGMPLAIALDVVKIALSHLGGIAERRIYWALAGHDPESHLPAHLAASPGLHSGFMIVQYSAAACCNELRTLAYPSSVGNIPTCAGIEDYNSMGATSALHAASAVRLARDVVACEFLVMAEALEHQRPQRSGDGVERAHAAIRALVSPLKEDRPPAKDLAAIAEAIRDGVLVRACPEVKVGFAQAGRLHSSDAPD